MFALAAARGLFIVFLIAVLAGSVMAAITRINERRSSAIHAFDCRAASLDDCRAAFLAAERAR